MTIGLAITAFVLGLRHGVDWDHLAAIADLTSAAASRLRGFVLSLLYASSHALVVLVLGMAAIMAGATLPEGVDVWSGRVVGLTLVLLGTWILVELIRKGRDFRLRSRWMLVLGGTFAGFRRVRDARARRKLTVAHSHPHGHEPVPLRDRDPASSHDPSHQLTQAHDHSHADAHVDVDVDVDVEREATVGAPGAGTDHQAGRRLGGRYRHWHRHSHDLALADRPGTTPGNGTAAGIGFLHGIGVESPTQIAVFVASTAVGGRVAGFVLLVSWVVGLVVANSILALLAGFGLLHAERHFTVYATVAVVVGVVSVAMGTVFLVGADVLPSIT